MTRARLATVATAILAPLAFLPEHAFADEQLFNPTVNERWRFEIGGMSQDAELNISAGPVGEPIDIVDLNRLGVDEEDNTLWLAGRWRINERWHFGLSYMEVDRTGAANASEEFSFGEAPDEVEVEIGASVTSAINMKYYIAQAGYSFVHTDRANIGAGGGFHVMDFSANISAELSAQGMTTDLGTGTSEVTAPLPNVYFFADYAFSPKFAATATAGWFGLEVGDYDGELVSASANLEFRPWENIGIGVGYTLVNVDASIDESDNFVDFEIDASGPRLYVVAGFGSVR